MAYTEASSTVSSVEGNKVTETVSKTQLSIENNSQQQDNPACRESSPHFKLSTPLHLRYEHGRFYSAARASNRVASWLKSRFVILQNHKSIIKSTRLAH